MKRAAELNSKRETVNIFNILLALVLFVFTLSIYLQNLPNVNTGYADSDEFLAAAKVWGVVHPPGYPLYTFLCGIFGRLPIPWLTFAGKVNLLSAVLHAATVSLVYLCGVDLIRRIRHIWHIQLISFIGSLSLAFSFSFWFFGLFAEVFALQFLLTAFSIWIILRWDRGRSVVYKGDQGNRGYRELYVAAFVFGLGISNQQAMIFVSLPLAFWVVSRGLGILGKLGVLGRCLGSFLAGWWLPYIYILIASRRETIVNWENGQNLYQIFRIITRKIYAEASPTGTAYGVRVVDANHAWEALMRFGGYMATNVGWIFGIVGIVGFIYLIWKREWRISIFLSLGIAAGGLIFALLSKDQFDTAHPYFDVLYGIYLRFFLLAPVFYSFFIIFGIVGIVELLERIKHRVSLAFLLGLVMYMGYWGYEGYREIKKNNFTLAYDYAKQVLHDVEPNAVILCLSEHTCFSATYVQLQEKLRPDVLIIPSDFGQYPIEQVNKDHPDLIRTTTTRLSPQRSVLLTRDLIRWNIDTRPIYVAGINTDSALHSNYGLDGDPFYLVPDGCLLRVQKSFTQPTSIKPCGNLDQKIQKSYFTDKAPISHMFTGYLLYEHYLHGVLYSSHLCNSFAMSEFKAARNINPESDAMKKFFGQLKTVENIDKCLGKDMGPIKVEDVLKKAKEAEDKKDYKTALYYKVQALDLKPKDINLRIDLGNLYFKAGAWENAVVEFNDILALDPNNEKAKIGLLNIKRIAELQSQ